VKGEGVMPHNPLFDMEELANGFLVTFSKTTPKTTQKTTLKTTRNRILACLKENPRMSRADLAMILEKSENTIKEHLANLKKVGVIVRLGSNRNGEWHVLEE